MAPRRRKKTALLRVLAGLALAWGLSWAGPVNAQTRVLVLPGGPGEMPVAGLAEVLRIQLGTGGSVELGELLVGTDLIQRAAEASTALRRADAAMVLWVERRPSTPETELALVAVLREGGRTLVATVKAPAEDQAAIERALAVKAVDLLRGPATTCAPSDVSSSSSVPGPGRLGLGLWGSWPGAGIGARGGLSGEAGWRFGQTWAGEVFAGARVVSTAVVDDGPGQLAVGEGDVLAGARLLHQGDLVSLGLGLALETWVLRHQTPDSGVKWNMVLAPAASAEVRVRLGGRIEARAALGAALPLDGPRLNVQGQRVLDYGHVRPAADLALLFAL